MYEPTNWKTGDVVTAEKLNNIENGISTLDNGCIFQVNSSYNIEGNLVLDKTWKQIYDAMADYKLAVIYTSDGDDNISAHIIVCACINDGWDIPYSVIDYYDDEYFALTEDDYPSTIIDSGDGDIGKPVV